MASAATVRWARKIIEQDEQRASDAWKGCIIITFPWDDGGFATCGSCGKRVSNVYAKRHALIDRYTDGCGVEFTHLASPSGEASLTHVRDDLPFRELRYAL